MNRFTQSIKERAQDIRLTDAERSRIRLAITRAGVPVPSPFWMRPPARVAVACAVLLIVVGSLAGTASAAEGALPGDLLYPVKVGITEPIEGALAVGATAKAKWHAQVAEARLTEAEALAEKGTLTSTTSAELAANFTEHADAVDSLTSDLSEADPISGRTISAQFSASVASKGTAILAAGEKSDNPESAKTAGDLVVAVAANQSDEATTSEPVVMSAALAPTTETSEIATSAPTIVLVAPPAESDSVSALSEEAHSAVDTATTTLATTRLSDADQANFGDEAGTLLNLLVKADAELSIGSTSDATDDYRTALNHANDLSARIKDATLSSDTSDSDASAADSDSGNNTTPAPDTLLNDLSE